MPTFTGNTVEEAVERGLKRMNAKRENVHVEIEQQASKGILGFGKKRARVSIEAIHEDTIRRADRVATRGVDQSNLEVEVVGTAREEALKNREKNILQQTQKIARLTDEEIGSGQEDTEPIQREDITEEVQGVGVDHQKKKEESSPVETTSESDFQPSQSTEGDLGFEKEMTAYIIDIVDQMGIPAQIRREKSKGTLVFNLSSGHDALLIGKHGKILQALEVLAKAYANMISDTYIPIRLNVGNYNEKREKYLTNLAVRAAEQASEGETVYVTDLPANERKIVHHVISRMEGVSSHSEGRDSNRYIVVSPDI